MTKTVQSWMVGVVITVKIPSQEKGWDEGCRWKAAMDGCCGADWSVMLEQVSWFCHRQLRGCARVSFGSFNARIGGGYSKLGRLSRSNVGGSCNGSIGRVLKVGVLWIFIRCEIPLTLDFGGKSSGGCLSLSMTPFNV